jgi:hypothetical protein
MWNDASQQQLNALRRKEDEGTITADEQHLLETLLFDLEHAEWEALRPVLSRLRAEQSEVQAELGQLQAQNAVLAALADRYADLIARAGAQLAGLAGEREALRREYERAMAGRSNP